MDKLGYKNLKKLGSISIKITEGFLRVRERGENKKSQADIWYEINHWSQYMIKREIKSIIGSGKAIN